MQEQCHPGNASSDLSDRPKGTPVIVGIIHMPSPAIHEHDAIGTIAAAMIDLDALDATLLQRDPFDFLVVLDFLKPDALAAAITD